MRDVDPNVDSPLDRLLKAAAQHRPAIEQEPPFGFTTRIIAQWQTGASREAAAMLEARWFRRAFLCALAVMAISVGWSYNADTGTPNDDVAIAGYDATADLP